MSEPTVVKPSFAVHSPWISFSLPGWPDIRGWTAIGFFLLTGFSLYMMYANPALLGIPAFMQFVTMLATGGVLLLGNNLWGGTKAGADANAKLAEAAKLTAEQNAGSNTDSKK